jgi:diguanylate cyclase (GGDEF)-like protein/PAS domain S-box-containing protein
MIKLAIAGGNIGGSALISLLRGDPNMEIVGIYEKKQDAPGVILARKWSIPVFEDVKSLIPVNPELIVNVTGDINLSNEIRLAFGNRTEVIEGIGARLIWEIIERQKKSKIETSKTIENQKAVFSLISKIGMVEPFDKYLELILEKAIEITNSAAGSIAVYKNEEMRLIVSKGLSRKFIENKTWNMLPGGLTEAVITNKKIVSIHDTLKSDYTKNNPSLINENIRALLAIPIIQKDKVGGILYIDDFKPRQFSERQKISLNILASLIGVSLDRRGLIREIEKANLMLLTLLEASNDMILIIDSYGLINFYNKNVTKLLHYTREDLISKTIRSLIKGDSWEIIQKELDKKSLLSGFEITFLGFGGMEHDVILNAVSITDPDGNPSGLILVLRSLKGERDLKKALEDKTKALEELNENLEKKVIERTEELEKTNRELEHANQLKGRFIANMSHELRTPLNSILGFSDVLLEKTFGNLTENQERYIKNIYSSGKHLLELINNILDIAKIEAGKFEMVYETFPVDDMVGEVVNIMKSFAANKFIQIVVSIGESINNITADKVKLKQILYNLLSNAIKFTPEGGMVNLDVRKEENIEGRYPWATTGLEIIKFLVIDTGIGISPEDKDRIFDEFEQANSSFSRNHGGAGLGLALTKKLVELHGGSISVESKLGEGSTFTFMIPVTSPVETVETDAVEAVRLNFPWMKEEAPLILVVEDDLPTAELLTIHLTQAGYKVAHAFDGEEAIDKAKSLRPFAITLDIMLPKKDGWEVLQELKSDHTTSDIPVIIHSIVDNKDLAFALGATDYLLKPLDKEALITKLEEITVARGKRVLPISILIIESEDEVTNYFKETFKPQGFITYSAPTGKRGLELASALRPDVILLDFTLSDMLGFDVIKNIKDTPSTKDIPIFILTERDISADDRMALVGKIERIVQRHAFDTKELVGHIKELEIFYPKRAGLIDELTEVFSHRYFQLRLKQEVERASRYKLPLNLILLDIDYFGKYVKDHGEYYGNLVLKKVAELLRKNIRGSDVIVRYGRDAFAIVLPNTVVSAGLSLSNRFTAIIKNYPFLYEETQPKGKLTASIGLAFLDSQTPEEFILCAEKALALAIKKGGDRVEVYSSEQDETEEVTHY